MTETSDEARVSKIANHETITNNLDASIYERSPLISVIDLFEAINASVPAGTKTNDHRFPMASLCVRVV